METKQKIRVEALVNVPLTRVWDLWTQPQHITGWNQASPDWHSPRAENDLRTGGSFNIRMEARDGSAGFDFGGTYDEVLKYQRISYTLGDDRKVVVTFKAQSDRTLITEVFDAESQNSPERQQTGWQSILDSFKHYAEEHL